VLSRVADSLYWTSRYLERAEQNARAIGVNLELSFDRSPEAAARHWGQLLGRLLPGPVALEDANGPDSPWSDLSSRRSITACVTAARENVRQVRESVSSEMWERVNALHLRLASREADEEFTSRPHEFFRAVLEGVERFHGAAAETMTRGEGWDFMQVGLYVERATATARLVDGHFNSVDAAWGVPVPLAEYLEWSGLLRSCCAFEAYCRRHTAELRPDRVAAFLLLDPQCPRSIRFACLEISRALASLSELVPSRTASGLRGVAESMCAALGESARRDLGVEDLLAHLAAVGRAGESLHQALYDAYITYPVDHQLVMA
jgi:uncharacterized alpha-E superfamily protein